METEIECQFSFRPFLEAMEEKPAMEVNIFKLLNILMEQNVLQKLNITENRHYSFFFLHVSSDLEIEVIRAHHPSNTFRFVHQRLVARPSRFFDKPKRKR